MGLLMGRRSCQGGIHDFTPSEWEKIRGGGYGAITFKNGRVERNNFNDYPILRMYEMPTVEVFITPSQDPPGGVGEPGVPPIAPAVGNAIFAATGKRIRKLPIHPKELETG